MRQQSNILLCFSAFSENGSVDMSGIVPDSITTWEATAFALNEETGLGIAEVPSNVKSCFITHCFVMLKQFYVS